MTRQKPVQERRHAQKPRKPQAAKRLLMPKKASPLGRSKIRAAIDRVFAARGE